MSLEGKSGIVDLRLRGPTRGRGKRPGWRQSIPFEGLTKNIHDAWVGLQGRLEATNSP